MHTPESALSESERERFEFSQWFDRQYPETKRLIREAAESIRRRDEPRRSRK